MTFKDTVRTAYVGYVTQAIVNCFPPLLYVTFNTKFGIPYDKITVLIVLNFVIQLAFDWIFARFADKFNPRICIVVSHISVAIGLVLMGSLPYIMTDAFAGLFIATVVMAFGGGIIEVIVSPIVEACPSDNKAKQMGFLHSFFCWGVVFITLFSTAAVFIFGQKYWFALTAFWALIPAVNSYFCAKVPINDLVAEGEGLKLGELLKIKAFLVLFVMMICSGACETAISQWVSAFAEKGLNISKAAGDIAGPCLFFVLMGIARVFYAKRGKKINLCKYIMLCACLCAAGYLTAALFDNPALSLAGCALCGFSVGVMWPGTYSIAAERITRGGNVMFAALALGGDIGCAMGPGVVGLLSDNGERMQHGILLAVAFPAVMAIAAFALIKLNKSNKNREA